MKSGDQGPLTHWGRVTHIFVSDLTIIGSDNDLSPGRRQAIIRTNAVILLIRPLGRNFGEILIEILIFSFKKMRLKVSSAKRRPFCLGLNVLIPYRKLVQAVAYCLFIVKPLPAPMLTCQFNTLRQRQNGRHFADAIFKCFFLNENAWIPIKFHWSLFPRVQLAISQHWFR